MKAPDRYVITLAGSVSAYRGRAVITGGFETVMHALLSGEECPDDPFRAWGLKLIVEEDVEYGDPRREDEAGMCNLYRLNTGPDELAALFSATVTKEVNWGSYIWPDYEAPIVISHKGERRIGPMKWGFPANMRGKRKTLLKHVTNARNLSSPFWKPSIMRPERRCLVPFTTFAEPKPREDIEVRLAHHWFTITDQPIAAFAGLWRSTDNGPAFAFLTCEPNALVAPLHPKAMPVVLMPQDYDTWLYGSHEEALSLQTPYPSQLMAVS